MKKLSVILSFFLFGLLSAVSINLISPANNTFTNQTTVAFVFNATDDENTTLNCSLYINDALNIINETVENSSITNFTLTDVSEGNYLWYINCSNGIDINTSDIYNLTIDTSGFIIYSIGAAEPDRFVSNNSANNQLTLIVNASDNGPAGIDYLTANFTALQQPGLDYVNMTYNDTTGLWNATITVTDVSNFEFTPLNVSVFGFDKAGNGLGGGQSSTMFTLYKFSQPTFVGNPCYQWGDSTTDLTEETDFEHVNYVLELQVNVSCMMDGLPPGSPSWMNQFETVALFNFTSLNFSDPSTGPKLAALANNMQVNITLPGEFGDSRIYFNTSYLSEFNTTAVVKLFHLPFVSQPNIEPDPDAAGYDDTSIVWDQGVGEGNLTFTVYGFSGYNITDDVAPNITLNSPNPSMPYTNDSTPTINITLNGTKTTISYLLVQIDNTSYVFNSTVNQTNCQATANPEIMNCVFDSSNLSNGQHTLFILTRDFGGESGNAANYTINFTVDTVAPTVNITSPTSNSIKGEVIHIQITVSETADTNISIYNSTGALVNSTMINNNTSISTSLSVPAEGIYSLVATSCDIAGNYGNATVSNITVDMTNPVVVISLPTNDTEFDSATITISGNSIDENLNYTNISIQVSGQLISSTTTTNSSWSVKLAVNASLSEYYIMAKAYDLAGNYGIVNVTNITVNDTTAPSVTAISATTSGSTVTLSVTTNEFAVCRYSTSDIDYENMSNMTTTGELSHSHSITYSSTTSGTFYVRCVDPIGNVMNSSNSTTFSVTISSGSSSSSSSTTNQTTNVTPYVPPVTPPTTQPQPEETPAPTTPISVVSSTASTVVFSLNAVAGEQITIDVAKMASGVAQGTGISKISIATRSAVSNVQVAIKPVEKPSSIPEPAKKVLNYIEIDFGGASDAVQSAKITFTLKKSDIRKQNIDSDTIKLLRYANGQWQELQTVKGFEDLESITFEATTPGFSYFAIAGSEIQAPAETPKVTTTTTEEEPGITVISEKKEESPLGLILLIAVILIIGYIVLSSQKPWKTK
ncbi:MAG: PGF-pre-PGF domain-containing protein [Candidatus Micrarchaeia archaeon]